MRSFRLAVLLSLMAFVAHAADQTILGSILLVKNPSTPDKRKVVGKAKETGSPNTIVGDPVVSGATLTVTANGAVPTSQTFTLPVGTSSTGKAFWSGSAAKGFKYTDAKGDNGPVKRVQIKRTGGGVFRIVALVIGKLGALTVTPPNPGTDGCMLLALGGGDSYSVRFGADGRVVNNGGALFKVSRPAVEGTCLVPSTTTTSSSTTTTTSSSTTTTTLLSGCFQDWGDGTIRDTCTGLQWEKKDGADGSANGALLHDVDNVYSWSGTCTLSPSTLCQPTLDAETLCKAQTPAVNWVDGCEQCGVGDGTCNVDSGSVGATNTVWGWVDALNDAAFAGHSDWRLPSSAGGGCCGTPTGEPAELESIIDLAFTPTIDPIFGPTIEFGYWSSTTDVDVVTAAWDVSFAAGEPFPGLLKASGDFVRAVR